MADKKEAITTKIWLEEPEDDNPFAASACYCSGFDVYGDLLGKVSWFEYLYLLFQLEPPSKEQAALLEGVAIALANPGPRDHSVRAAMNAGVGGSTRASALMAAVAVGAGNLGGGREVYQAMQYWLRCDTDIDLWLNDVAHIPQEERIDVWLPMEHPPGFDPNGASCPKPVRQVLSFLSEISLGKALPWLQLNREKLEQAAGMPLAMSGVAAAAFHDLEFAPEQAESIYIMLRLPGAAAHSLEQEKSGWRKYPFFGSALKPINEEEYQVFLREQGGTQ